MRWPSKPLFSICRSAEDAQQIGAVERQCVRHDKPFVEASGAIDDTGSPGGIGDGNDHPTCAAYVGVSQNLSIQRIAMDGADAIHPQRIHAVDIFANDSKWRGFSKKALDEILCLAWIFHDNDMVHVRGPSLLVDDGAVGRAEMGCRFGQMDLRRASRH